MVPFSSAAVGNFHSALDKGETGRAMFLTNGTQTTAAQSENELVFNKYGDKRFLSLVISAGYERKLNESKNEREVAHNTPPPATDQIVLARR